MAAYINNRSMSMMAGDGPHNSLDTSLRRTADNSPLQVFVKAKRRINDIYAEVDEYVREVTDFMASLEAEGQVVGGEAVNAVCSYIAKVQAIRDVLRRDNMKVAFFGRTSNGKSTVINAMLRDKILPSGIGHTTNCFLQVEGSDGPEAYLVTDCSTEKRNVQSVGQLAHALCKEKLSESQLVRIYWPRDKCSLLRDDVVFVDSPGVDVTPNLDEWIDKHCLDADVFVLVANAESTLMVTEKNFFHKVSAKLSKPNIFILNNRWDASASEPEYLDQVRRQHQDRGVDFLAEELRVCERRDAEERIFFVSAKEALQARLAEQGVHTPTGQPPAEGFQTRYFEFQDFERRFEECISKSAVRTKFEQHATRGRAITAELCAQLDATHEAARELREKRQSEREYVRQQLEEMEEGIEQTTHDTKLMISQTVEDVERRVSCALSEEIRRLAGLVDEFCVPFHPEPLVLNVYKKDLHAHVERGLGSNLRARLSAALATNVEHGQSEMLRRVEALLPLEARASAATAVLPRARRPFELLYRLNCDNLCADFHEDLEFRFSWGATALVRRFCRPRSVIAGKEIQTVDRPLPSSMNLVPVSTSAVDWAVVGRAVLATGGVAGAHGTVGGLLLGGFLVKTVGWRLVVVTGVVYGLLYIYERLTWTNAAKERQFKKQYVEHATRKLRLIVDLTSANCSHQVQQELSGTFARLCHALDEATGNMSEKMAMLDEELHRLEDAAAGARVLRNKAGYLQHELDLFEEAYLRGQQAPT